LPAFDQGVKDGGGDTVVGGGMAVVGVAAEEVTAGDEAAGFYAELGVKRVRGVAVFDGEAGEESASSLPLRFVF